MNVECYYGKEFNIMWLDSDYLKTLRSKYSGKKLRHCTVHTVAFLSEKAKNNFLLTFKTWTKRGYLKSEVEI